MKGGDRSSKYFYAVASHRRSNEILKLKDSFGIWHSNQSDLERVATDYF